MASRKPWPWHPARSKAEYYTRLRRANRELKARQIWHNWMNTLALGDREYLVIEHRRGY